MRIPNPDFLDTLFQFEGELDDTGGEWVDLSDVLSCGRGAKMFLGGLSDEGAGAFEARTVQGVFNANGSFQALSVNDARAIQANAAINNTTVIDVGYPFCRVQYKSTGASSGLITLSRRHCS